MHDWHRELCHLAGFDLLTEAEAATVCWAAAEVHEDARTFAAARQAARNWIINFLFTRGMSRKDIARAIVRARQAARDQRGSKEGEERK